MEKLDRETSRRGEQGCSAGMERERQASMKQFKVNRRKVSKNHDTIYRGIIRNEDLTCLHMND